MSAPNPEWTASLIPADATIRDAIKTINDGGYEIALVVDGENKLLGTITDGDIRRWLLDGMDLDASAEKVMNPEPLTAQLDMDRKGLLDRINAEVLRQIPLLDDGKRVVGIAHIRDLTPPVRSRENWVVLMAGGLGERLRPLTEEMPKPLLSVGGMPLLQTIMDSFVEQNFSRFYISINYQGKAIKERFGDGSDWNVDIRYLEEDEYLGTAGSLKLIPDALESPFIVMNGDLITKINFQDLLDYHDQQDSEATMCVRKYDFQVPFGVVGIEGNLIRTIDEKPVQRFFVNAGIYMLDPGLISLIPDEENFDMTDLFEAAVAAGKCATVFPVHEYWLDVGRMDDLDRANHEFGENFGT